jgi:hypothetical protein
MPTFFQAHASWFNAVMQTDGNFVLYDTHGHSLWSSGTSGHAGADLAVQEDGNLVVYKGSAPLWASHTHLTPTASDAYDRASPSRRRSGLPAGRSVT